MSVGGGGGRCGVIVVDGWMLMGGDGCGGEGGSGCELGGAEEISGECIHGVC